MKQIVLVFLLVIPVRVNPKAGALCVDEDEGVVKDFTHGMQIANKARV